MEHVPEVFLTQEGTLVTMAMTFKIFECRTKEDLLLQIREKGKSQVKQKRVFQTIVRFLEDVDAWLHFSSPSWQGRYVIHEREAFDPWDEFFEHPLDFWEIAQKPIQLLAQHGGLAVVRASPVLVLNLKLGVYVTPGEEIPEVMDVGLHRMIVENRSPVEDLKEKRGGSDD